jgi:hypothetical protein
MGKKKDQSDEAMDLTTPNPMIGKEELPEPQKPPGKMNDAEKEKKLAEEAKRQTAKVAGDYFAECKQWKMFTDSPKWTEIVKQLKDELDQADFDLKDPESKTLELRQAQMSILAYEKVMDIPKKCVDELNLYLSANPLFSGEPIGTVKWDKKNRRIWIDGK